MGLSWGSRGSAAPLLSYLFTAGSVRPRFPLREWDWGGVRWALYGPPPTQFVSPPSPVGRGVPVVPVVPASPAALGPPPSRARPSAPMGWSRVWGGGSRGWGRPPPWGGGQPPRPPAPSRAPQPLVGSPWGTPWVLTTPARPAGPGCPGLPGGPWRHRGGVQLGAMPPTPGTCPHSPPRTVPVLPVGSEPLTMSPGGPCRPWGPMGPGSPCGKQRDEWGGGHGTHPTLGSRVPPPPLPKFLTSAPGRPVLPGGPGLPQSPCKDKGTAGGARWHRDAPPQHRGPRGCPHIGVAATPGTSGVPPVPAPTLGPGSPGCPGLPLKPCGGGGEGRILGWGRRATPGGAPARLTGHPPGTGRGTGKGSTHRGAHHPGGAGGAGVTLGRKRHWGCPGGGAQGAPQGPFRAQHLTRSPGLPSLPSSPSKPAGPCGDKGGAQGGAVTPSTYFWGGGVPRDQHQGGER